MKSTALMIAKAARGQRSLSTHFKRNEFWLPFTNNRDFKQNPKYFKKAQGMFYYLDDGKEILDACSGLWCVNAGHGQRKIIEAIKEQAEEMDYAPCFNISHSLPFEFSRRLLEQLPGRDFGNVFFTNCGSTAVDTALKIALAYHRANGNASRTVLIGRERGYHGVGFGGISVGGIGGNRKTFASALLPSIDHLPHTHSLANMAFSKGLPQWGAHLADELERLVALHDASNVAAVIVEPVAGSTGVIVPPVGYLKRLRDICTKHGILLIYDEVITGFGRLGASFAAEKFDVTPDIITCAKGLTNGFVPAGAVISNTKIYDTLTSAADRAGPGATIEFFHGYTYSGHPLAMAAGIATLDVYKEQGLYENCDALSSYWEEALHSLKNHPNVIDIRNCGLMGAVELSPQPAHPSVSARTMDIFHRCLDKGLFVRVAGPNIALSPPLILNKGHIDRIVTTLGEAISDNAKAC